MATAAERKRKSRARQRAALGDEKYKRIERDKMRAYRASKWPPKRTIIINNQAQPQQQPQPQPQPPQPQVQSKPSKNKKAPQKLIRAPQQVSKITYLCTSHLMQLQFLTIQYLHI